MSRREDQRPPGAPDGLANRQTIPSWYPEGARGERPLSGIGLLIALAMIGLGIAGVASGLVLRGTATEAVLGSCLIVLGVTALIRSRSAGG